MNFATPNSISPWIRWDIWNGVWFKLEPQTPQESFFPFDEIYAFQAFQGEINENGCVISLKKITRGPVWCPISISQRFSTAFSLFSHILWSVDKIFKGIWRKLIPSEASGYKLKAIMSYLTGQRCLRVLFLNGNFCHYNWYFSSF